MIVYKYSEVSIKCHILGTILWYSVTSMNVCLKVEDENMNILIVDDSKMVRRVLENMLLQYFKNKRWLKPDIFKAEDGLVAMQQVQNHRIDIIFLDYNMPNMNGEEVVESIRANKVWNRTRIIMATTEGSRERVLKMIKKGVNSYIVKPFCKEAIFNKLDIITARMLQCSI